MTAIAARGKLQYHFDRDYYATITLEFYSSLQARQCLSVLGLGWKVDRLQANKLVWHEAYSMLEPVIGQLASMVVKTGNLANDNLPHIIQRIDFGETFDIVCQVATEQGLQL